MKIKKIFILLIFAIFIVGCTKLKDESYDNIINKVIVVNNSSNVYRKGYKYFIPKGLKLKEAGSNYAIIESKNETYYLFVDLISFNNKTETNFALSSTSLYSKHINYNGKKGYADIKKIENNQYLIEIMYNYAKIEVMVDDSEIKYALANSISILKSIVYDEKIISSLLKDDNLTYTEEMFDMFRKSNSRNGILDYTNDEIEIKDDSIIKDSDLVN